MRGWRDAEGKWHEVSFLDLPLSPSSILCQLVYSEIHSIYYYRVGVLWNLVDPLRNLVDPRALPLAVPRAVKVLTRGTPTRPCSLSAGIPEAEIDKPATVKFSMCRLEIKCN